jgi:hypothetical protein
VLLSGRLGKRELALVVLHLSESYFCPGKPGESRGRKATGLTVSCRPRPAGLPTEVFTFVANRVLFVPDASLRARLGSARL